MGRLLTDDEQKTVRFEILKYIDRICRENGIHYSLTGGTLLGAVRHHGFIPWDDDIDIFLTRPEYDRLDAVLSTDSTYFWLTDQVDSRFHFNFGRLIDQSTVVLETQVEQDEGYGVFVDICVVDGLPGNALKRFLFVSYMRFLYHARSSATYDVKAYVPKNRVKRILKSIFQKYTRHKGMQYWHTKIARYISKYPFDCSQWVGNITSQYGRKEIMHHSSFEQYIEMEFENAAFQVIAGWEEYLKNIYGDYMRLPPKEQQVGHHMGSVYWRD